jgi:hypothetical protein
MFIPITLLPKELTWVLGLFDSQGSRLAERMARLARMAG